MAENFIEIVTDAARAYPNTTSPNQNNRGALPQFILSLIQQKHNVRRNPAAKKTIK